MIAMLLSSLKSITVLGNWGWLLWGQLWTFAHPVPFFYSVVVHEAPLFCVVKYNVVLNDNIKLPFYRHILLYFYFNVFQRFFFFLHAGSSCRKPLKAQLYFSLLSYHTRLRNMLIILCGHTEGVIATQSSWNGRTTVSYRLDTGRLNTVILFTPCI